MREAELADIDMAAQKCPALYYAMINKGSPENFIFSILDNMVKSLVELEDLEKHYINSPNTLAPNRLNLTCGGNRYVSCMP